MDSNNSETDFGNEFKEVEVPLPEALRAWDYYNYATNYRTKKMNKEQYWIWRRMMIREGKGYFFKK